ncbi:hypothetical protein BGZ94_009534 [Podila epigama]|nr:hypothetical protein BGZ94_009534 [Podila epigama]
MSLSFISNARPAASRTIFSLTNQQQQPHTPLNSTKDSRGNSSTKGMRVLSSGSSFLGLSRPKFYSRRSLPITKSGPSDYNNATTANNTPNFDTRDRNKSISNNSDNGSTASGDILNVHMGHGASSRTSTTLVGFYSAAKLAPPLQRASVEEYVRRLGDANVWYIIQVYPCDLSIPGSNKMPIPRKSYCIYRRYEDILKFADQLEYDFPWLRTSQVSGNPLSSCLRDNGLSSHWPLLKTQSSFLNAELENTERKNSLHHYLQELFSQDQIVAQSRLVAEFFGIWKSDMEIRLSRSDHDPLALHSLAILPPKDPSPVTLPISAPILLPYVPPPPSADDKPTNLTPEPNDAPGSDDARKGASAGAGADIVPLTKKEGGNACSSSDWSPKGEHAWPSPPSSPEMRVSLTDKGHLWLPTKASSTRNLSSEGPLPQQVSSPGLRSSSDSFHDSDESHDDDAMSDNSGRTVLTNAQPTCSSCADCDAGYSDYGSEYNSDASSFYSESDSGSDFGSDSDSHSQSELEDVINRMPLPPAVAQLRKATSLQDTRSSSPVSFRSRASSRRERIVVVFPEENRKPVDQKTREQDLMSIGGEPTEKTPVLPAKTAKNYGHIKVIHVKTPCSTESLVESHRQPSSSSLSACGEQTVVDKTDRQCSLVHGDKPQLKASTISHRYPCKPIQRASMVQSFSSPTLSLSPEQKTTQPWLSRVQAQAKDKRSSLNWFLRSPIKESIMDVANRVSSNTTQFVPFKRERIGPLASPTFGGVGEDFDKHHPHDYHQSPGKKGEVYPLYRPQENEQHQSLSMLLKTRSSSTPSLFGPRPLSPTSSKPFFNTFTAPSNSRPSSPFSRFTFKSNSVGHCSSGSSGCCSGEPSPTTSMTPSTMASFTELQHSPKFVSVTFKIMVDDETNLALQVAVEDMGNVDSPKCCSGYGGYNGSGGRGGGDDCSSVYSNVNGHCHGRGQSWDSDMHQRNSGYVLSVPDLRRRVAQKLARAQVVVPDAFELVWSAWSGGEQVVLKNDEELRRAIRAAQDSRKVTLRCVY